MNLLTTVKTGLVIAKNWTVEHSPELLLGTSIAAGIGATVTGCIATKKMEQINARHKEALDILHASGEELDGGSADGKTLFKETPEYKRNLTKEYGRYGLEVAKTWAPCVGLTLLSGTCAFGSFKIVNGRLIKAEMAFAGIAKAFEQYRDNVIEDQGEEKDLYYANNGALKKKAQLEKDGKYKAKEHKPGELVNKQENLLDPALKQGIFHYLFCKESVKWGSYSDAPTYNLRMLLSAQTIFDNKLKDDGMVLLDEVYSYLGLDMSELHKERAEGRMYGWTLNCFAEDGMPNDQHVLFGILEYNDTQHRLFRAGQINDVTLHFNCRLLTKETNELLAKG